MYFEEFNLRYPFWHDRGLTISGSEMTEHCRAALWYSEDVEITDTKLYGIKALRECADVRISGCDIISPEFGWSVRGVEMKDNSSPERLTKSTRSPSGFSAANSAAFGMIATTRSHAASMAGESAEPSLWKVSLNSAER